MNYQKHLENYTGMIYPGNNMPENIKNSLCVYIRKLSKRYRSILLSILLWVAFIMLLIECIQTILYSNITNLPILTVAIVMCVCILCWAHFNKNKYENLIAKIKANDFTYIIGSVTSYSRSNSEIIIDNLLAIPLNNANDVSIGQERYVIFINSQTSCRDLSVPQVYSIKKDSI